ncbi:MAG TPA: hypothetical protein ENK43_10510 [Planctomycetes bacterium]|nr:hypothetical protein [Planctomycetota bacterium]
MNEEHDSIGARLEGETDLLMAVVRAEAADLFRFEQPEDLVQHIKLRVIEGGATFVDRGDMAFRGWLRTIARRTIADRRDHWMALKRNSGPILSLSFGQSSSGSERPMPDDETGPATWAARRETLVLAMKALSLLPEKDRALILAKVAGEGQAECRSRFGLSEEAMRKACMRAEERLRKTFRILLNS